MPPFRLWFSNEALQAVPIGDQGGGVIIRRIFVLEQFQQVPELQMVPVVRRIEMPQTVYMADDEKNIRELISAFFTQEGYQVETFSDGDALLAACWKAMPQLVILDVMMPGTDGFAVCFALRKEDPHLPILIVSAKDSPYDRGTGLTPSGDDYLVKPFPAAGTGGPGEGPAAPFPAAD